MKPSIFQHDTKTHFGKMACWLQHVSLATGLNPNSTNDLSKAESGNPRLVVGLSLGRFQLTTNFGDRELDLKVRYWPFNLINF